MAGNEIRITIEVFHDYPIYDIWFNKLSVNATGFVKFGENPDTATPIYVCACTDPGVLINNWPWGDLTPPTIKRFEAFWNNPTDTVFGAGDGVEIEFNVDTYWGVMARHYPNAASLNWLQVFFQPDPSIIQSFGAVYSGQWINPTTLRITFSDVTGNTMTMMESCVRVLPIGDLKIYQNKSLASTAESEPITGAFVNFRILSIVAVNPFNDLVFSPPDRIEITFSEATSYTNYMEELDKGATNDWLQPRVNLGDNYRLNWLSPSVMVIYIDDPTGATLAIGDFLFDFLAGYELRNLMSTSNAIGGPIDIPLTGSFIATAVTPPVVTLVLAWNPANRTDHTGAQISARFNVATNQGLKGTVYSQADVDTLFQPSASLGSNYSASWTTSTTVVFTIHNGTGALAEVGSFVLNIAEAANIRVGTNNSLPMTGQTSVATGAFFFVPGKRYFVGTEFIRMRSANLF